MDVIVDGEQNFKIQGDPENVLSVIVAAGDLLRGKGRGITAIRVDGVPVTPEAMAEALESRAIASVTTLEIVSGSLRNMIAQSLDELQSALPDLPEACHSLAEVFQGDEPESGYDPFHRLAEIWRHIKIRESEVAHALDLDLDALDIDGTCIREMHESLNNFLAEAAEALEREDCVLLGDLLEYELAPRAEVEAGIVALLRERAARQTDDGTTT